MIDEINKMGDVKPYVKQGFFDYRKIEEIFNQKGKISQVLDPKNQGCELVNLLIPIFNKAVPQPKKQMNDLLELIKLADQPGKIDLN